MKNYQNNSENNIFDIVTSKSDIVDVISHYVKLEKKGRNYEGLCPFHDDKNLGNFHVSPEKQIFKCFACNESGNVIQFVKKIENISYIEAAKKVCEIEGINLPELENFKAKKVNPKLEKTYEILNDISNFYSLSLFQSKEGQDALKYLHERGLNDDIIRKFSIGYSLKDGTNLINFLTQEKKYSLQDIDNTGIIDLKNNILIDKNHGRITFAIKNSVGKFSGFSCRIFGNVSSDSKYVNTPTTIAFNKSSILYNFYEASYESKKYNYIYIVEGFMDVIACVRAGITSCVGLMGTAFTKEHLELIKSLNCQVRVCLDLDNAGQQADLRMVNMLEKENISYLLVNNCVDFKYKDCDEILSNLGEEALRKYLNDLIDLPNWMINYFKNNFDLNLINNKEKMVKYFAKYIKPLDIKGEYYLTLVSDATNLSKEAILNTIKEIGDSSLSEKSDELLSRKPLKESKLSKNLLNIKERRLMNLEKQILYYILKEKEARFDFSKKINYFYTKKYNELYDTINKYLSITKDQEILIENFIKFINESKFANKNDLIEVLNQIINSKVRDKYSKEVVDELIKSIKSELEILLLNKSNEELIEKICDDNDENVQIFDILSVKTKKKVELVESRRKSNGNK